MKRFLVAAVATLLISSMVAHAAVKPKVVLLIDEKNLGTIPTGEVEAMAADMLVGRKIRVVDTEMVRSSLQKDQALLKMAGDARGSAAVGLQFGASIVISGTVVAKPSAHRIEESKLRAYQATATLRAIRTDNADILASVSESASIAELDDVSGSAKALRAAGKKALSRLLPSMLENWDEGSSAGAATHDVEIVFGGLDQIWKLKSVRDTLKKDKDVVSELSQLSYTAGTAHFSLVSTLPPEELAERLVITPPRGLKCQVLDIVPGKLTIRVVPAQ